MRGRDLGSAVEEAIKKVNAQVQLPRGYHIDWEGEYESEKRAEGRLLLIVPLTILVIFLILAALLGLGAASFPARRAARLDVLTAIATN